MSKKLCQLSLFFIAALCLEGTMKPVGAVSCVRLFNICVGSVGGGCDSFSTTDGQRLCKEAHALPTQVGGNQTLNKKCSTAESIEKNAGKCE